KSRPATAREKRYNFVEDNPFWVMQGDRIVQPPEAEYRLPRNKGIHVVGGRVRLRGESQERFAAFEVDSHDGEIIGVFV
ncbi:MAG: hypothetical protein R3282_10065, partial [Rhodothermales bacterium]|nr:hypothetical protein [Rhodothermales bacterium]